MRIVVDAMGTDNFPAPDVEGAVLAARESGIEVVLVGDEKRIKPELAKYDTAGLKLDIVHTDEMIEMDDKPSVVGKGKPNSSMHIGMNLVKEGQAQGFVTMGNTGAAHAIAMLFTLKRIPGIKRPALSAIFKFMGKPMIFLDIGANADVKPEWLVQFALMGAVYAQNALGITNPGIRLLSNGEEEGKGTEAIREADRMLRETSLNYTGNIEPKEIFKGEADVIVTDGFTGNILAKTFEASTRYLTMLIRDEVKSDLISMLGGLLIRPAIARLRKKIDTFEVGGAPLLGVQGVVIIGHGRSNGIAVRNAIYQARKAAEGGIIEAITQKISQINSPSSESNLS